MKVLLINGSPHEHGCTHAALEETAKTFQAESIQAEIFWIGREILSGCTACMSCGKTGRCRFDDSVNPFLALAGNADGFIVGSPVHYAAASGGITSFLDRAFYAAAHSGQDVFYLKPAAAVAVARRAGTTAALDQLSKYFTLSQMPMISSQYWNMVHGTTPEEIGRDLEGLQTLRVLARNMAWFLRCKEAGRNAGIPLPEKEPRVRTNFTR